MSEEHEPVDRVQFKQPFEPGDRVRVKMSRGQKHLRSFNGVVINMTSANKVRILENDKTEPGIYRPEDITKLAPKHG